MPSRRKLCSFYGFVLSDDVNQSSLKIPKKFTQNNRKQILLNDVLLITPDSTIWPMGWVISGDGNLWFQKGWPEFAEHYRLKYGYFLIFERLSESIFSVRIFGQNCCEINHSPTKITPLSVREIDESVSEDEEDFDMAETEQPSNFQETEVASDVSCETEKLQSSRNRALEAAKSFKSNNPFYSVTISVSYSASWGLYLPIRFLRRYLSNGTSCILQTSDRRTWGPIMCRDYKGYGKLYGENWKKFREENNLDVGDVLVFELINEGENVLKVTIFRASC